MSEDSQIITNDLKNNGLKGFILNNKKSVITFIIIYHC